MPEFQQWVSRRSRPDMAYSYGLPVDLMPFMRDIRAGRRLKDAPPAITVHTEPEFTGWFGDDFTVTTAHCLLLSPRLVDVLRKAGVDSMETHPCRVIPGSAEADGHAYSLMIIRDLIGCLDWEKSELEVSDENPRDLEGIDRLAIDESRLAGCLLFRLAEDPSVVIVHNSVAEAIVRSESTGVAFAPVDGTAPLPTSLDQLGGEWPEGVDRYIARTVVLEDLGD